MTDIYINHRSSSRRVCALHRSEKASPRNGWPPYDYYLPFILATKCHSSSGTGYGDYQPPLCSWLRLLGDEDYDDRRRLRNRPCSWIILRNGANKVGLNRRMRSTEILGTCWRGSHNLRSHRNNQRQKQRGRTQKSFAAVIFSVEGKRGMNLRNGMWHDLRNDIIMRNVIYAEWLNEKN